MEDKVEVALRVTWLKPRQRSILLIRERSRETLPWVAVRLSLRLIPLRRKAPGYYKTPSMGEVVPLALWTPTTMIGADPMTAILTPPMSVLPTATLRL